MIAIMINGLRLAAGALNDTVIILSLQHVIWVKLILKAHLIGNAETARRS
jgi:hypothetical protein